jgi:hypothetical protein
MTWRYRKRIKIIPGVHLNLSNSGISTTIGVKGASVNIGNNGTYVNNSIPGTGLYSRKKIGSSHSGNQIDATEPASFPEVVVSPLSENIFSLDPHEIGSQSMEGLKQVILTSHQQRMELINDLAAIQILRKKSSSKLILSYILLYGFIKKSLPDKIKKEIAEMDFTIQQIKQQIEESSLQLDYHFEDSLIDKYHAVTESFKKLISCQNIWDMTSAHTQNRVAARSAAGMIVTRKEVKFGIKPIPDIKANLEPFYFQNGNGADLYFYPHFVIVYSSKENFAIIGLEELRFTFAATRFIETSPVPSDTEIIDRTWAKVNKNGTPDKRFKENYEIPVVRYGNISLKTLTGINEEYEFSNYGSAEAFSNAFLEFQKQVTTLKEL